MLRSTEPASGTSGPPGSLLGRSIEALLSAEDREQALRACVGLQVDLVRAHAAVLLHRPANADPAEDPRPVAAWKEGAEAAAPPAWLPQGRALAGRALAAGASCASHEPEATEVLLAQPLYGRSATESVAVLELPARSAAAVALARERLELVARLLGAWESEREPRAPSAALELLALVAHQKGAPATAHALCSGLADRLGAARVAVGLESLRGVRLIGLAHALEVDRSGAEAGRLERVLEACRGRDLEAASPPVAGLASCDELDGLGRRGTGGAALAVPLRVRGRSCGALLVEHEESAALGSDAIQFLRLVADLAAPLLVERERAIRAPADRARHALVDLRHWARTPRRTSRALAWAAVGLALLLVVVPAPFRIEAPFVVKAQERRIVTAPFDGRLLAGSLQPGDRVVAGETLLAVLDTEELELEWGRVRAEYQQALKQADAARTERRPAAEQIALYQAAGSRAAMELVATRIEQARIVAPVDGVVLAGDLRRRLGAPVARGETLVEVAPLSALEAELEVAEGDVRYVEPGQEGEVVPAARPGDARPVRVVRIDPLAVVRDQRNVFSVVVSFGPGASGGASVEDLLPGMRGVARIEAGRASRLWQWTREALNALRLRFWI